jgi:hypothetical protein
MWPFGLPTLKPGSVALNRKVNESPGSPSRKATFRAIRAAWKSIECVAAAAR